MATIPIVDWGRSGREDSYQLTLVDPFTLEDLDEVEFDAAGSGITYAMDTDTRYSATIQVLDDLAKDSMLRIRHSVTIDGVTFGEEMGTFFAKSKSMSATYGRVQRPIDGYSCLLRHRDDYLMISRDYHPGDNVAGIMQEIITADGGQLIFGADAPTDVLHTMDVHWDIGTNKLEMIETMAQWIGGEIEATPHGQVQLNRYYAPGDRPVSWTFEAGANCIYKPGLNTSEDEGEAYNRALYYCSTDEGSAMAYADLAPSNPYSYDRIGRHVTYTEELGEAVDSDTLQSYATGFMQTYGGGAMYCTIEHAGVPGLRPGMTVRYINEGDYSTRVDNVCLVTEMSVSSLAPMCMTQTKLRVVA